MHISENANTFASMSRQSTPNGNGSIYFYKPKASVSRPKFEYCSYAI